MILALKKILVFFRMTSKQIIFILLAIALAAALYFTPTQSPLKNASAEEKDYSVLLNEADEKIPDEEKNIFQTLKKKYNDAVLQNTEAIWLTAASDFLKQARSPESENKALYYRGAVVCFENVLQLNPENVSAKTNLGTCMVEGSFLLGIQPMEGIRLLREAVQQDSANIEAHLQLGIFSVTSRQFEKAIERFEKVLKIDSSRRDVYVYLGDTYLAMGNKSKAIEYYERYKSHLTDTLIQNDIEKYIKKLKH